MCPVARDRGLVEAAKWQFLQPASRSIRQNCRRTSAGSPSAARSSSSLERRMQEHGYLDAHDMATSFNMLRANDLI
jgi:hypothetical protein